jgi:hypothetical protein
MLPAQLAIVAEAALGPTPDPGSFLKALKDHMKVEAPPPDALLFGSTFGAQPTAPFGTLKNQEMALRAAEEFQAVCDLRKAEYGDLDDWMRAFAYFTLAPQFLVEGKDKIKEALDGRKAMCAEAKVSVRTWAPQTLKTMVNALALLYRNTRPVHALVMSSTKQFPNFNKLFNVAVTKARGTATLVEPIEVLQDFEVEVLYERPIGTACTKLKGRTC